MFKEMDRLPCIKEMIYIFMPYKEFQISLVQVGWLVGFMGYQLFSGHLMPNEVIKVSNNSVYYQ